MKKKFITLVCLLSTLTLAGGLTACTSGGSDDGKLKIEFWHTFGQGIQSILDKKIQKFQTLVKENEGVDLVIKHSYQGGYNDIKTKIEKGFSAANVPTIAVAYPDHVANYLRSEPHDGDYVTDLQALIDDPEIGFGTDAYLGDVLTQEDFVEAFLDEGRHFSKEGTFTLPYMKSSEVMFYNEEAVKTALNLKGISLDPASYLRDISWEEFIEFNKFVAENKEKIINTLEIPVFYDSDANMFISKLMQNDIPYASIDANGKGHVDFEEEANLARAKELVKGWGQLHKDKVLTTKGANNNAYGSDNFTQQKSIFSIGSSGGAGYNIPTSDDFTVGIVKVPYDNNKPLYVTQGPCLTMLKNPAHKAEETALKTKYGWKFIKYLLEPVNNVEICVVGSQGYVPVTNLAYETDEYTTFLENGEDFAKTANVLLTDIDGNYLNTPVFPGSAELRVISGSIVTQTLLAYRDGTSDAKIDSIFAKAIADAKLSM